MKPYKAVFIGISHFGNFKVFNCNLLIDIKGHPRGSTVSLETLLENGIKKSEIVTRKNYY